MPAKKKFAKAAIKAVKKHERKEIKREVKREMGKAAGVPVSYAKSVSGTGRPIKGLGRPSKNGRGGKFGRVGRGTFKRYTFSGTDMVIPNLTATGTVGTILAQLYVSPTQLPTPRLNILSQLYERYQFRKLKFRYVPGVPTSAPGTITMHYDNDANDLLDNSTAATNIQLAMSHKKAVETPVFKEKHMVVKPTLLGENEYWVDSSGAVSRQSTQGLFIVLNGPSLLASSAGYVSALGSILLDWTIDFWVEVTESPAGAVGAPANCEMYYHADSGGLLSAANLNTTPPLVHADGKDALEPGNLPDIGSCPGVGFTHSHSDNTMTIAGNLPGTYVFVQFASLFGADVLGAATSALAPTSGAVNTAASLSFFVSGTTRWVLFLVFSASTSNWKISLAYPSVAGCTISASTTGANGWRRSWLFKMPGFAAPKPKSDLDVMKASIMGEVMKMMDQKKLLGPDEKELPPTRVNERDFVTVDQKDYWAEKRPPPLKPARTPGRAGGPNSENVLIRVEDYVSPAVDASNEAWEAARAMFGATLNVPG